MEPENITQLPMSIHERKRRAREKSFFYLAKDQDNQARLKLRPVYFEDVLNALGVVNPEVWRDVQAGEDQNTMYQTFKKYAEDKENFTEQMRDGRKMQEAYLVLGIDRGQSEFGVCFDDDPEAEKMMTVTELRLEFDTEIADLEKRIKTLSGIREDAAKSKSK